MPYRRFRVLLSCLHLADNTKAVPRGQPGYDKLFKLRPLLKIVQENMLNCYNQHREVSIDEAMVDFKGRSSLRQYMPMKPTKWGFKVWCGSDAWNGLTFNISVYAGAGESSVGKGLGEVVVMKIAEPLLGKGHCLYYDNFFSSVELVSTLLTRDIHHIHHQDKLQGLARQPKGLQGPQSRVTERRTQVHHCVNQQWTGRVSCLEG